MYFRSRILSKIQHICFSMYFLLMRCCSIYLADGVWVDGFVRVVVGTCGIIRVSFLAFLVFSFISFHFSLYFLSFPFLSFLFFIFFVSCLQLTCV